MQSLEELIDQQINLGHKDPHEYPELLHRALGDDLLEVVRPYLDDFISEMGRQRLNALRRNQVARITKNSLSTAEILLRSMWVPDKDSSTITYKKIADMTADDFDARADYLEHMARGIRKSARWCRDCAEAIRNAKVKTAGKLGQLPPLREADE